MKAKRRVVTSSGRPAGASRTPTAAPEPADDRRRLAPRPSTSEAARRPRPPSPRAPARPPATPPRRSRSTSPSTSGAGSSCRTRSSSRRARSATASSTATSSTSTGSARSAARARRSRPRIGNPTPRVTETPGGMLNSIGLQNPGVDAVIEKYAETWAGWKVPVIVNVAGESVERLRRGHAAARGRARRRRHRAQHLVPERRQGRAPVRDRRRRGRRGHGRRPPRDRPAAAREAVAERRRRPADRPGHRRRRRRRPDRDQHAVRHRRRAGPRRSRCSATSTAACRGPAVKPVALRIVYEAAQVVDIPVVAIGGVTELADVLDFLAVGAVAVQVGTAIFADPTLPVRLVDELAAECRRRRRRRRTSTSSGRRCRSGPARRRRRASSTGPDRRSTRRLADVTTIKPALDLAARAGIAQRTEALFRASGAFREGHFQLKSGRHGDAYVEKFAVLSDPAATSELCGFWAAAMRGADDAPGPLVDLVAGPTTGGVILAFETARQLGVRSIFAEEVRDADGGDAPRVPARLHDRARRAGPARRRHPHDRRLAAGDDPGGRGDGRRDRRVRGPRRPQRRASDADVAGDRPRRTRCARSGSSTCRPTSRARRRARGAPPASRSTRRAAPGPATSTRRRLTPWIAGRGTCSRSSWSWSSRSRAARRCC